MRRISLFALLFVLLLPPHMLRAQSGGTSEILRELQAKAGHVETLASRFRQEKHLSVFDEPVVSEGVFYFRQPASLYWEYLSPYRTGFLVDGYKGRRWSELEGERDVSPERDPAMRIVVEQIVAWTTFELDRLRQDFTIEVAGREPLTLHLVPKGGLSQVIDHLRIVMQKDRRSVARIELYDVDGDFTRIVFSSTRINQPIPAGIF